MKIKPKDPKKQKIRRIIVGGVAACAVLGVLLHSQQSSQLPEEEGAPLPDTAVTSLAAGQEAEGEIDWEYPPGWVDYSDLPPVEELGDEDRQILTEMAIAFLKRKQAEKP